MHGGVVYIFNSESAALPSLYLRTLLTCPCTLSVTDTQGSYDPPPPSVLFNISRRWAVMPEMRIVRYSDYSSGVNHSGVATSYSMDKVAFICLLYIYV